MEVHVTSLLDLEHLVDGDGTIMVDMLTELHIISFSHEDLLSAVSIESLKRNDATDIAIGTTLLIQY